MTVTAPHPRREPDRAFADRLLTDLLEHWGTYRPLGRLYAAHLPSYERCEVVAEAMTKAERLGFVVEADRGRGYRVTGYHFPERVYLVKPGRPAGTVTAPAQMPGQLSLVGAEG